MKDDDERAFVDLQRAAANRPASRRRSKSRKDTFAMVPLWWIEQAARATENPRAFVLIWLLHLSWKARSMTFPVPNAGIVKRGGSRWAKYGVLDDLEAAGLITVERRPGKTPIVTLVCL